MKTIPLTDIRTDGGTQSRAGINRAVVDEYAEAIRAGAEFPPVVLFFDGTTYWMADGFHRHEAHLASGATGIAAEVRQGTQRDARLYSAGANATHGLRRTNEDKRRAVLVLLSDPEWSAWSNREIARRCGVSEGFVRSLRTERSDEPRSYITKHGTAARMDTGNIGKSGARADAPAAEPVAGDTPAERQAPQPAADDSQPAATTEVPAPCPDPYSYGYGELPDAALLGLANSLRAELEAEKAQRVAAERRHDWLATEIREMLGTGLLAETIRRQRKKIAPVQLAMWPTQEQVSTADRQRRAAEEALAEALRKLTDEGILQESQ